ncbi:MAG: hypothetical protein V4502_08240 [Pseudomonadota bacterium]
MTKQLPEQISDRFQIRSSQADRFDDLIVLGSDLIHNVSVNTHRNALRNVTGTTNLDNKPTNSVDLSSSQLVMIAGSTEQVIAMREQFKSDWLNVGKRAWTKPQLKKIEPTDELLQLLHRQHPDCQPLRRLIDSRSQTPSRGG